MKERFKSLGSLFTETPREGTVSAESPSPAGGLKMMPQAWGLVPTVRIVEERRRDAGKRGIVGAIRYA